MDVSAAGLAVATDVGGGASVGTPPCVTPPEQSHETRASLAKRGGTPDPTDKCVERKTRGEPEEMKRRLKGNIRRKETVREERQMLPADLFERRQESTPSLPSSRHHHPLSFSGIALPSVESTQTDFCISLYLFLSIYRKGRGDSFRGLGNLFQFSFYDYGVFEPARRNTLLFLLSHGDHSLPTRDREKFGRKNDGRGREKKNKEKQVSTFLVQTIDSDRQHRYGESVCIAVCFPTFMTCSSLPAAFEKQYRVLSSPAQ